MKGHGGHTRKHAGSGKHAGTGKHRPRTAAQQAATHKWQQAGAKARHAHVVGSHSSHAKPSKWSPNADVACCAAEALAASLRLAGHAVSDDDVLDLYWLTADHPDAGATLEDTIAAALEHGLAGVRPLEARPVLELRHGTVFAVDLLERHALTLTLDGQDGLTLEGQGVWSWGEWWPLTRPLETDEAWELTWPR